MLGSKEIEISFDNLTWFGGFAIYSSSEIYVITRRYQKLQDVVAGLGGLANSLFWIGYFLTRIEKEFIVFRIVISKLYKFSTKTGKKQKKTIFVRNVFSTDIVKEQNIDEIKETITFGDNGYIQPINPPNDDFFLDHFSRKNSKDEISTKKIMESKKIVKSSIFRNFKKIFEKLKFENEEFSINFFEFIKAKLPNCCFNLSEREKLVRRALKIYKKEIDIVDLVQKLHDIDKLKFLLLSPEQFQLFNCVGKPIIHLDKKRNSKFRQYEKYEKTITNFRNSNFKENSSLEKLQKYYVKVKNEGNSANPIDIRLVSLIDANTI